MSPTEQKDLDLTKLPSVLQVYIEDQNPIVIVSVHEFFGALYPDGQTDGDPGMWGIIVTDAVRHVAKAHHEALCRLAENGLGPEPPPEEIVLSRIMEVFLKEMEFVEGEEVKGQTVMVPKDPKVRN